MDEPPLAGGGVLYPLCMDDELQQLHDAANALRAEAKSLERHARVAKQMAARHVECISEYQSQSRLEDTDGAEHRSTQAA